MLAKHGCVVDLEYVTRNIRIKAAQLLRDRCVDEAYYGEGADIEQDLWLTYLATAHTFDANRASFRTFVSHVLEHAAAAIARRCKRPQPTVPPSSGEYFLTDNSEADAVDFVLETLPAEAREICRRLRNGSTLRCGL